MYYKLGVHKSYRFIGPIIHKQDTHHVWYQPLPTLKAFLGHLWYSRGTEFVLMHRFSIYGNS